MMIRNVGSEVSRLIGKHKKKLGLKPTWRYIRYLVLQCEANYKEHGLDVIKATLCVYLDEGKYPTGAKTMKNVENMPAIVGDLLSGLGSLIGMKQADFLRALVYQDRDFIEEYGAERMKETAKSYGKK